MVSQLCALVTKVSCLTPFYMQICIISYICKRYALLQIWLSGNLLVESECFQFYILFLARMQNQMNSRLFY